MMRFCTRLVGSPPFMTSDPHSRSCHAVTRHMSAPLCTSYHKRQNTLGRTVPDSHLAGAPANDWLWVCPVAVGSPVPAAPAVCSLPIFHCRLQPEIQEQVPP
ncbi:unnamed protein product [Phytophthora lilii]|uniref:Unnamed protein product n=1 Tax=Phytophthora lilii TaxID=2077276 RepID=A0A9W6WFA4_9STRA|nr:unnamed protein product [Phytophthora lilii]